MSREPIVVVGNGIAGQTACDALRQAGFDGELVIIGGETHRAYSRPALSKALLHPDGAHREGAALDAHLLPEPRHQALELLGTAATALDPERRRVLLDSGEQLRYGGLVIASGTRARRLPGAPAGRPGPDLVLRTLDDALELRRQVAARPSVLVAGGGPLGMEIASGALAAGCRVTLVSSGAPLAAHLGPHLAGLFQAAAVRRGLRIVDGGRMRLAGDGTAPAVQLADGTVLEADLLVSAVGDEPNTGWLAGSGLLQDGALLADSRGRVRPEVVAAGDVASFPAARGGHRRTPLWTSAIDQAKTAALGLLQQDDAPEFDGQPYFWTEGFGLTLKIAGDTPLRGAPETRQAGAGADSQLMRWAHPGGSGTAAALNYRIPVPRLRRLAATGQMPAPARLHA